MFQFSRLCCYGARTSGRSSWGGRHRASRGSPTDRAALRSSSGLLPTESWAPCGCFYACARTPPITIEPSLGERLSNRLKRHLRSTGADTRLSSNHGSNERSPLRRNFQPRRWRTAGLAITRCAAKGGKRRPRRTQISAIRRCRTTRTRPAREAITAARWRQLPRVRRSPADRGPAVLDARQRPWPRPGRAGGRAPPQSSRCNTHT